MTAPRRGTRVACRKACPPGEAAALRGSLLPLELLRDGVAVRLRVTGSSMAPYLVDEDLVTLEPVDAASVRFGDLVYTGQPGHQALLHRVIGRVRGHDGAWTVLTKGDSLVTSDPATPAASVAGRVVVISRASPAGTCRVVRLTTRPQRLLQRGLALGSRHAPRAFSALSRRLVPHLRRLAVWVRRTA